MAKEVTLDTLVMKPSDFKVCEKCGKINWYENEDCIECGENKFNDSKVAVMKWAKDEYDYWMNVEGYTEEEADNVYIEV